MENLTQYTVNIHNGRFTDMGIVFDMLHTILTHICIINAFMYMHDTCDQYH